MRHTMKAGAMAAAVALAGCAGQGGELSAAIDAYCNASTPQLRAILRVPLVRLLGLPADTGELFCVGDTVVMAAPPASEGPAAGDVTTGE